MSEANENTQYGLVRPSVSTADAVDMALTHYGVRATARELGSNQDRNFLLEEADGTRSVLRIDNPVFSDESRSAQHTALLAYRAAGVDVPAMLPGLDGQLTQVSAEGHTARRSEFAAGETMVDAGYLAPAVVAEFGTLAAASVNALAGLTHPGLEREHMWVMRVAYEQTVRLSASITDEELRGRVLSAAEAAHTALEAIRAHLPSQAIHGDLTDDNVLGVRGTDSRLHPHTVIDLGDLAYGWRVSEIAITASSLLHHDATRPLRVLDAIAAFHRNAPLSNAETMALWPLIVLRGAILVASGWRQLEIDGDNDYARERISTEQAIFDAATALPLVEASTHVLARLHPVALPPQSVTGAPVRALLPDLDGAVALLDPGVESPALEAGRWLRGDAEERLSADAFAGEAAAAVLPYGVYRLTRTVVDTIDAAATWPVGTEVFVAPGGAQIVTAPAAGFVLTATDDRLVLDRGDGWLLRIDGLRVARTVGESIAAGDCIGLLAESADVRCLVLVLGRADALSSLPAATGRVPLVEPDRVPAWARLTRDPGPSIGLESVVQRDEADAELHRREHVASGAQERYYERPMQVQRGWRHHLVDTTGRAYLDLVNNVTGLGHGHPGVADAVDRQIRTLATNSRFLYRELAEYSERLLEMLPAGSGLDTVILVNSGSEAVDLAIRLAQAATGRETVVALREAYHGWTVASDAITTSAYDNPSALHTRPGWVHIADVPNRFRGTYRGAAGDLSVGARYAADLGRDLAQLHSNRRDVAALICESVLGNAGGVLLPEGYLADAYARVRAAGGVCIADEVQVGFGRMGSSFWGFEQSDVIPDIVTIAKPMGNGFPIGGVITSRAVAAGLATQGQFFSSTGGNPMSCRVGLAVLDAMEAEGLQENARTVGTRLAARLRELASRHTIIGPVHGEGLYLGIELVRDHSTMEPADREAAAICERLRELGVIVLTTSERSNVLKVKPPLCLTTESADFFVAVLDRVLSEGW